jgi:hypothetical protein
MEVILSSGGTVAISDYDSIESRVNTLALENNSYTPTVLSNISDITKDIQLAFSSLKTAFNDSVTIQEDKDAAQAALNDGDTHSAYYLSSDEANHMNELNNNTQNAQNTLNAAYNLLNQI